MEQHTPLGEGTEWLLPLPALPMCNLTDRGRGGGRGEGLLRGHILHMKSPVATPMLSRAPDLCSNFPLESLLCVNEFSGSPPLTVMVIVCPRRIFK